MKKNKKYWKKQAKSWREIAEMETESANEWAGEAFLLRDEVEELKYELNVLRQYNIGKPFTMKAGQYYNIPVPPVTTGTAWAKNVPTDPFANDCKCGGSCPCKQK